MGRTFIRQDTQIHKSDTFTDNLAAGSTLESGSTSIEGDLNSLRSRVHDLLNVQTSNWYAVINTPSALDAGSQRGVNNLNTDLHALQRKRVLASGENIVDVAVPAAAKGTGVMSIATAGNFIATDTITTGTKTYTFVSPLVNVDGNVLLGATASDSIDNLVAAITLGAGSGTVYAAATTANTFVTAVHSAPSGGNEHMTVTALSFGSRYNATVTTETGGSASWAAVHLTGGTGDAVVLTLAPDQLPPVYPTVHTAAIGAVATQGTVAATSTLFGSSTLAEVGGSNVLNPKNLCAIYDSTTHDPILSGGREIYALFQTESASDGSTMTGTTPNRAMLSFVRINIGGTALEQVPTADIAGLTVHYAVPQRKALEDLNEQDFLRGATVDIAAATTVTRQLAYDNQGTTPVELTTNADIDLNAAGIFWKIRDLANADLFTVTEGSTGGTTDLTVGADVDTLTVNAIANVFDKGAIFANGGTPIKIAKTIIANTATIENTGATTDLRMLSSRDLYLDDVNQTGSTWAQTNGIKLSAATGEWDLFETNFGEVSLLNAINQAKNTSARNAKVYSNVTSTTVADTDISLADSNLDTALPAMNAGSFLTDYDVFLNGNLLRPGATSGANNDYYPGSSITAPAKLKFEFTVKINDVLCVVPYA